MAKDPNDDRLTIDLMVATCGSGFQALAINEERISSGKCCGNWRRVRRFTVSRAQLQQLLNRPRPK